MSNPHPRLHVRLKQRAVYSWVVHRNIRMKDLSKMLGIHPCYMSQFVHGRRYPSPRYREKFLSIMKPLKWDDLFVEEFK